MVIQFSTYYCIRSNNIIYIEGVECWDAYSGQQFTLHAYILSWSGDIPALTKLMCLMGHNSYMGCRFCYIRGRYARHHVYFPLEPTTDSEGIYYDPGALPLRTHSSYTNDINRMKHLQGTALDKAQKECGMCIIKPLAKF